MNKKEKDITKTKKSQKLLWTNLKKKIMKSKIQLMQ